MKIVERWCPHCLATTQHLYDICGGCCKVNEERDPLSEEVLLERERAAHPEVCDEDGG